MSQPLPASAERVPAPRAVHVNQEIRCATEERIAYDRAHAEEIEGRLAAVDHPWDVERALEAGSSVLPLTGLALGLGISREWLLLPTTLVEASFLQHALHGCPPLPRFRRLGFRTPEERARAARSRHASREARTSAGGRCVEVSGAAGDGRAPS